MSGFKRNDEHNEVDVEYNKKKLILNEFKEGIDKFISDNHETLHLVDMATERDSHTLHVEIASSFSYHKVRYYLRVTVSPSQSNTVGVRIDRRRIEMFGIYYFHYPNESLPVNTEYCEYNELDFTSALTAILNDRELVKSTLNQKARLMYEIKPLYESIFHTIKRETNSEIVILPSIYFKRNSIITTFHGDSAISAEIDINEDRVKLSSGNGEQYKKFDISLNQAIYDSKELTDNIIETLNRWGYFGKHKKEKYDFDNFNFNFENPPVIQTHKSLDTFKIAQDISDYLFQQHNQRADITTKLNNDGNTDGVPVSLKVYRPKESKYHNDWTTRYDISIDESDNNSLQIQKALLFKNYEINLLDFGKVFFKTESDSPGIGLFDYIEVLEEMADELIQQFYCNNFSDFEELLKFIDRRGLTYSYARKDYIPDNKSLSFDSQLKIIVLDTDLSDSYNLTITAHCSGSVLIRIQHTYFNDEVFEKTLTDIKSLSESKKAIYGEIITLCDSTSTLITL